MKKPGSLGARDLGVGITQQGELGRELKGHQRGGLQGREADQSVDLALQGIDLNLRPKNEHLETFQDALGQVLGHQQSNGLSRGLPGSKVGQQAALGRAVAVSLVGCGLVGAKALELGEAVGQLALQKAQGLFARDLEDGIRKSKGVRGHRS
jgi:hypothetical protein